MENNSITPKILHLSLIKAAFEVMVTGEKACEYRKPSKFILSRIKNKQGFVHNFSFVKFVNGYGNHRPYFIAEFLSITTNYSNYLITYSNGLEVKVEPGDVIINLGNIIKTGNL